MKKILILLSLVVILLVGLSGGAVVDRIFGLKPLDKLFPKKSNSSPQQKIVLSQESVVINVAENVSPSVVTVSVKTPKQRVLQFSPFGGFSESIQGGNIQDIGTGFILTDDGLIVTNKHVVTDTTASYKVSTKDGKEYDAKEISRDPSNDIAIIKIDVKGLKPINLGDSTNLKVGQFVIAIGTALGEFRDTVTTGVVSGLGRGITAGSSFESYVERLDDVIQTDAAINLGNSGGPLLNSSGEVIGINVAVAQGAQNIGFAIPINVVKDALNQFKQTGKFLAKPYLGVRYQAITQRTAIMNNVPQGMYVVEVVVGSPAEKAGIQIDDIITKIDNTQMTENTPLSDVLSKKKSGDEVNLEIWRNGEILKMKVALTDFKE